MQCLEALGKISLSLYKRDPAVAKAVLEVYKPHGRQIGGDPARNAFWRVSHYALDSLAPDFGHVLVATLTHHASCAFFAEHLC